MDMKSGLKRNFYISLFLAGLIFIIGISIMMLPSYYGRIKMSDYEVNNLFLSFSLLFTIINIFKYILIGLNPNREAIFIAIVSAVVGICNIIFIKMFVSSFTLALSIFLFTMLVTVVKLFSIDYYHDREDAFFYIETMCLIIFFVMGFVVVFSLFDDNILQCWDSLLF